MKMIDSALMGSARVTDEGYLVANVRTARIGTQDYRGVELDRPDLDTVTVYRDEAEVFRKASLQTFGLLPVTDDHPSEMVTADTARMLAVGTTAEEVLRDGEYLRIGIKLTDAATIRKVRDGKRELSVGYTSEIIWGDGIAPNGTPYQARQTNIVGNHIAIVDAGRAGPLARIGDGEPVTGDGGTDRKAWGASPLAPTHADTKGSLMADTLQTVVLGDAAAQVAIADAPKVEAFKAAMTKALADAAAAHKAEIDAKDVELAAKDAKIAASDKAVLTDADMDARVEARADLIGKAKTLSKDIATAGLSDAAIRKAAVAAVLGDAALTGKADAYVDAMFDIQVASAAKGDPVADAMTQPAAKATDLNAVYAARDAALNDAWKPQTVKKEA